MTASDARVCLWPCPHGDAVPQTILPTILGMCLSTDASLPVLQTVLRLKQLRMLLLK